MIANPPYLGEIVLAKIAFIGFITLTNFYGARLAGTVNDLLTAFKLAPLLTEPQAAAAHLTPFAPKGLAGIGDALVPIFWAYAGFELATIPAGEVRRPTRTIPLAIMLGMAAVTVFYLLTNLVLLSAVRWEALVGTLGTLIRVTVFSLAVAYLLTSLAAIKLERSHKHSPSVEAEAVPDRRATGWLVAVARRSMRYVPYGGVAASLLLLFHAGWVPAVLGLALSGIGLLVYSYLSPEQELVEIKAWITSRNDDGRATARTVGRSRSVCSRQEREDSAANHRRQTC